MSSVAAYNELKTRLQTTFAPMPVLDFDSINPALEQGTSNFLCIEEVVGFEDLISIGDPSALCFRAQLTYLVYAFVPAPESSLVARTLAEQVQTDLRLRTLGTTRVLEVEPPEPDDMNDGLWTVFSVTVSTVCDFQIPHP